MTYLDILALSQQDIADMALKYHYIQTNNLLVNTGDSCDDWVSGAELDAFLETGV